MGRGGAIPLPLLHAIEYLVIDAVVVDEGDGRVEEGSNDAPHGVHRDSVHQDPQVGKLSFFLFLSIYLSIYLSICLSTYLYLSIYLSIYLSDLSDDGSALWQGAGGIRQQTVRLVGLHLLKQPPNILLSDVQNQ